MKILKSRLASVSSLATTLGVTGFAPTAVASFIVNPTVDFIPFNAGAGTAVVSTPNPGDVGNTLDVTKTFDIFESGGSSAASRIIFQWDDSVAGVTTYSVTDTVTNNTDTTWDDFHFAIGCGFGEDDCPTFFPLIFDELTLPTLTGSPGVFAFNQPSEPWLLWWTDMNVPPGNSVTFTFGIETCANCIGAWRIRQTPSVPEPTTLTLLGLGLAGLGFARRRRLNG